MKKETFIAFCNQKGGIGKSALTILAASTLRYSHGLNVLVVDCDYPQHSIAELREREKNAIMGDDAYKAMLQRQFERLKVKSYPILRTTPDKAIDEVRHFLDSTNDNYDVVLFDLPGTINTNGVLFTMSSMDYLFVPMRADRLVMQSTINFARIIHDRFVGNPATNIKDLFLFWNMEDRREKTNLYDLYENLLAKMGLKIFSSRVQMRSKFSRELADADGIVYRSTLFRSEPLFIRESGFADLMDEVCTILKS